ncbi:MAG: hypothetical protein U9R42_14325, partial [Bacteroidota bacterium]|nr:hypothetical protein [Bacteroidota bacterium]
MGCHKLKYYESETAIGKKWKFFVDGIEKIVNSQKICKDYYAFGSIMPPPIGDTVGVRNAFLNYLYTTMGSLFLNEVIKPCLKDTNRLPMIASMFQGGNPFVLDTILANIYSVDDFGRLINSWTRDRQIIVMGGGIMTEPVILEYKLKEHHIYGSSRLGIHKSDSMFCEFPLEHYYNAFYDSWEPVHYVAVCNPYCGSSSFTEHSRQRGKRFYELNNHLGNVLSTVTDRKLPI